MWFIGIVVILVLIHFLIIRPLTQRNRPQRFDSPRGIYEQPIGDYGSFNNNSGFGRFGTFAGGIAAGALLTYLFEQGRIGFDQFTEWQQLGDKEIMQELQDQNILQEHEIAQLQEEIVNRDGNDQTDWGEDIGDDTQDLVDYNDQDDRQDQGGFGDWDSGGDDNWV
ncbi:hypothetical protein [Bacillus sp. EB600]|uniref:hypothetical protein n=1 Tax=Bacillus sp. EB600 TaxID=2806345 RepID=UPI00210B4AFE|nr:hypothetical protein [Bacillus sp. EB600]MCQ6280406.1 hypothetical protein [Bacillus sp. EB600]